MSGTRAGEELRGGGAGYVEVGFALGEDSHPEAAAGPAERAEESEQRTR